MSVVKTSHKISVPKLRQYRVEGRRIAMATAYDFTFARLLDEAEIDIILVGDSLGMVVQGGENTLSVTLDEMIYHTKCVARGVKRAHVMLDMPFLSYQASAEDALRSAGRALKESGCESVKLEGGMELVDTVHRLTTIGIPVMAHIGLRPQRVHQMGGYAVQGKKEDAAALILEEAKAFTQAGAFGLLLEGVPATLAKKVTESVAIPTIGIGAGASCDGQVLVIYDLLGMDKNFKPKFVRHYAELHDVIVSAARQFGDDVRSGKFPSEGEGY